jgi:hypothetical protein
MSAYRGRPEMAGVVLERREWTHQRHPEIVHFSSRALIKEVLAFADSAIYVYRKIVRRRVAALRPLAGFLMPDETAASPGFQMIRRS